MRGIHAVLVTLGLSAVMMAGLFLMLWGAVAFVQDKRLFTSAPKEVQAAVLPKKERFPGARLLGWKLITLALLIMAGALFLGALDGIERGFGFWDFFARFAVMLLLLKAYDILFFDWFLLCRSGFFPRYYPETRTVLGPHLFGYNKKSHLVQALCCMAGSLLAAWICTRFVS